MAADVPGKRLILAPTGSLTADYADVRCVGEAAAAGVKRALKAGATCPQLMVSLGPLASFNQARFANALHVAVMDALAAAYVPLEVREDPTAPASDTVTLSKLFVHTGTHGEHAGAAIVQATALEAGRAVARDICGGDPERMAPPKVAEYVQQLFKGSAVSVEVEEGPFGDRYPLLAAVARASEVVERHKPRVINLEYAQGTPSRTLYFVGKGITYDTGGADIKAGGIMAGMHRDKGGAAAVAGFFHTLVHLAPKNIRVVGKLAMVRNSVGADAYVADEIIHSRAGVRVRVGNTDAEGRMAMADLLCKAREEALASGGPANLFTVATLTGHVIRAYGLGYTGVMDNGPAQAQEISQKLAASGLAMGDPCEVSTVRREDFAFIRTSYSTEDVLQSNNAPSSGTSRGHQYPAAFLTVAAGIDKHGAASEKPVPYTHMDIAGRCVFGEGKRRGRGGGGEADPGKRQGRARGWRNTQPGEGKGVDGAKKAQHSGTPAASCPHTLTLNTLSSVVHTQHENVADPGHGGAHPRPGSRLSPLASFVPWSTVRRATFFGLLRWMEPNTINYEQPPPHDGRNEAFFFVDEAPISLPSSSSLIFSVCLLLSSPFSRQIFALEAFLPLKCHGGLAAETCKTLPLSDMAKRGKDLKDRSTRHAGSEPATSSTRSLVSLQPIRRQRNASGAAPLFQVGCTAALGADYQTANGILRLLSQL